MSLYLFDTDMLTLYSDGHPRVCEHVATHPGKSLATSIITVEEHSRAGTLSCVNPKTISNWFRPMKG